MIELLWVALNEKKNEFISWFSTILFTLIDFDALSLFPHRRIDAACSVHSFSSASAMEGKLECVEWLVLKCSQLNWIERLSREFSSSPLSVEWNKESKSNRNNLESFNRFGSSWKRMAAALRCERRWKEKRTFPSSNYIWWYIVERKSIHEAAAIRAWAYEIKKRGGRRRSRFCVTPEVIHMRFSKHISRPIQLRRWDNRPSQAETRAFALRHLQQQIFPFLFCANCFASHFDWFSIDRVTFTISASALSP